MPFAPKHCAIEVDALSIALTEAHPASTSVADEFYNAVGKAPHPDAIVPKRELGWWVVREKWNQRKAQEPELAALQLREVQKQAAQLAEENAALERELKDACQSLFRIE